MGQSEVGPGEQQAASGEWPGVGLEQNQDQDNTNETTKMRVRASSVDQDELIRLVQVEAMELPDLGLVVSGMAGRFPKSDSVNEFEANLREGRDMINDQDNARFTCGLWGLPPRAGRLNDLSRFDHEFFGFTMEEANYIDFQLRILYEVVYESILDAGVNPASLRGTKTGVFFGLHCNEFENAMADDPAFKSNGYYAQFAVKVAQYFDFRGLTLTFDAACASGFVGLHNAVEALRDGICDQAIVCSSNIPVHPTGSFIFFQMQMLSPTGYSRFLDSRADGYVKSEACVSVLLQREQVAKRNYASFMATMTSVDGFKSEGITFPSHKSQETLIRRTKELARVSTNHVEYLEAHGTGTPAGDPQEARAISNVYYQNDDDGDDGDNHNHNHNHNNGEPQHERRRIGPLLVGSVKTNMGHSEAASGLCALVKAALMFENELIYRNLHFEQPNTNIEPLMDGRLKFVDEPLPLRARIIPLSCYGFGGSNVHVICRSNKRERIPEHKPIDTCGLPRLVLMFGRGQVELERFFERIGDSNCRETRNCLTEDFLSLIDSLSEDKIDRLMNYRGFCLFDVDEGRPLVRSVARCDLEPQFERPDEPILDLGRRVHRQETRPRRCHLAFAGLGCQWQGMAAGLARLKPFWTTIERVVSLLEPGDGQNLVEFLLGPQQDKLNDRKGGLCQSFVAIVAYQMALVNLIRDTLKAKTLGALIGHSLGEVSCAYAAGLFDERETLMVAYQMGKTLDELGSLVAGKMVALVGLEWRQVVKLVDEHRDLYESLRVSCINGPNSVTISGHAAEVDEFLLVEMEPHKAALMVFEVSRSVALHNDFVMDRSEVRAALRRALERVLLPLTDYERSKTTWLSSFLGDSERDQQLAKQANVDYFIEMLCRPINIVGALERLEPDSIICELSPSNSLESQVIQFQCPAQEQRKSSSGSTSSANATVLNRRRSSLAFGQNQQQQQQQQKQVSKRKFHYVKSMQKGLTPEKQVIRLLSSLGELFQMGLTLEISQLYASQTGRKPQFPVRRQTPSISSLIEWQHSNELFVPRYPIQFSKSSAKSEMPIDLVQDRDKYLAGHCVDGRVLHPATGYLLLVWRVFSFTKRKIYDACFQDLERELMPIEFRDVRLMRAVILGQRTSQLYVHFEEATGRFEVKEGGSIVVEGYAVSPEEKPDGLLYDDVRTQLNEQIRAKVEQNQDEMLLNKDDVYKQFRLHGYDYGETFQCVESSSWDGLVSRIKFNGHFVSLTDSILQSIFLTITRCAPPGSLFLPTRFDYVRFQPKLILAKLRQVGMSIDQSDGSLNTKAKREMMAKIMQRDGAQTDADNQAAGVVEDEVGEEQKEGDDKQAECIFETYCDAQTGIIVTDGIEMRGVKASPAPRRLDINEALLESYQFVSDIELPVNDERLVKFNSIIRPYGRACDSMSLELLMKLFKLETSSQLNGLIESAGPRSDSSPLMSGPELESYKRRHLECAYDPEEQGDETNKTDERRAAESSYDIKRNGKRTLMSVLDQLIKLNDKWQDNGRERLRERLQMNRNHLLRDLLQASFTCERFIRPLVETVLENVCQKKSRLRLLEINPDDGILRPSLQQLMSQIEPNIVLDYSLAHPNPGKLHGSQTAATTKSSPAGGGGGGGGGQQAANIKTYTLKPQQLDALFSDHQLKGLDLVVCKDASCYRAGTWGAEDDLEQELSRMLTSLCQTVAPSGYCLLLMRCQMTLAERVVLALNDDKLEAGADFGPFALAVDQMNEQLADRCNRLLGLVSGGDQNQFGWHLTAQKSDPNGCLMLLLRRIKPGNTMNAGQLVPRATENRVVLRVRHDQLDWLDELKASFKQPEEPEAESAEAQDGQQNEPEGGPEEVAVAEPKQVWLCAVATRENQISGLVGMMQSLRKELGSSRLRCFYDMFSFSHLSEPITIEHIEQSHLFREALKRDHIWNCVDSSGRLGAFRHFTINEFLASDEMLCSRQAKELEAKQPAGDHHDDNEAEQWQATPSAFVNNLTRGDLSSFAWFEAPHKHLSEAQRRDQLVQVAYSALNFRDVMLATGRLPLDAIPLKLAMSDCQLGLEFSGLDGRGRRVMGMVEGRGIATHVLCPRESSIMIEIPDWMSLREAATIPVVYATVIMAMICRGQMQRGESILVHAGSGGVGQAAIRIGLHFGLELYTTVGSQEKRHFLLEQFGPLGLKAEHIFDSRSCQFETDILSCTNGRGVDMVLNSLADDKLQASLNCLAAGGRFLEIGKYDMSVNARLELLKLEVNKSFHGILVDKLFDTDELNESFKSQLKQVLAWLQRGLQEGFIKPIQHKLFPRHQIEEAFRFMATGKHIGKVLIEIEPKLDPTEFEQQATTTTTVASSARPTVSLRAVPRVQLSPHATFIVTGGLGGFGLELCKWLAQHGARQLVLTSRQGLRTGYQRATLRRLEQNSNVEVRVVTEREIDASQLDGARKLLDLAHELAREPDKRVGGIFHLAMVLRDSLLDNMAKEDFELVLRPKVATCVALDEATRQLETKLDYFVAFSSITSGKGNAGQANYAYANSCLERVCERRRSLGLHGLAIQWGAIGDVGVAFENLGGNEVIIGGTIPQRMPSCLATLARLLASPFATCLSVLPVNRNQEQLGERGDLVGAIMHVLGIKEPSKVSDEATLGDLGLDSLMAVEIRQYIEREHDITLNIQEIRALTIAKIREIGDRPATAERDKPAKQGEEKPQKRTVASYGSQTVPAEANGPGSDPAKSGELQKEHPGGRPRQQQRQPNNLAQLDKRLVRSFVPALELPADDFCLLNPDSARCSDSARPIFFLAPIHGRFEQLRSVCASIERPCIGLNWTRKLGQAASVDEAVEIYLNLLEQADWAAEFTGRDDSERQLRAPKEFGERQVDLVGYSFGATIAFELMVAIERRQALHKARLERRLSNGSQRAAADLVASSAKRNTLRPGRLVLLDGSPKQIELGSQYLDELTRNRPLKLEDKVDELLLVYMMANLRATRRTGSQQADDSNELVTTLGELKSRPDLRQKVEFASAQLARILARDTSNLKQQATPAAANSATARQTIFYAMEAFLRRYELINSYRAKWHLAGGCTLIRARELYLRTTQSGAGKYEEDLELKSVVKGDVQLHVMSGDHESFMAKNQLEIASIIEQPDPSESQSARIDQLLVGVAAEPAA